MLKVLAEAEIERRRREAEGNDVVDEAKLLDFAETCLLEAVSRHPNPTVALPDENEVATRCASCGHVSWGNPDSCRWRGCANPMPEPYAKPDTRPKYLNEQTAPEPTPKKRRVRPSSGLIR